MAHPDLLKYLQENQKKLIFTAGLVTSICVYLTTESAFQHGFFTAIVEDCCADKVKDHEYFLSHKGEKTFLVTSTSSIVSSYPVWNRYPSIAR